MSVGGARSSSLTLPTSCLRRRQGRVKGMEHLRDEWQRRIVASSRQPSERTFEYRRAERALGEFFTRTAMPSWRGLMAEPIWTRYDGCVLTDPTGSRRRTFETFIEGETDRRFSTLAEAKAYVESKLGSCTWQRIRVDPVEVEHYYFGPTTMFTDPTIAYAATRV